MIYFIGNKERGFVKIGYTSYDTINNRFSTIQTGCPYDLEVFGIMEGDQHFETFFHRKFKHLNMRGEWFIYTPDIQAIIDNPPSLFDIIQENKLLP